MTNSINDEKIRQDLSKAQSDNVGYIEWWSNKQATVIAGVNVVQVLDYELCQMLNHAFLKGYLGDKGESKNA